MQKLRISAVSYLNTRPFIEGMNLSGFTDQVDLSLDIPSVCASKLLEGSVDVGLVPVAVLPLMKEYHILTDYCIGAVGPVRSVALYSEVPLAQIKEIILDNQSRTSVALVKILCEKLWKITPKYTLGTDGYETLIQGETAAVVIGDRTFALNSRYPFIYDLAEAWIALTGLPFVFACWVSNKPIGAETENLFNQALSRGLEEIDRISVAFAGRFPANADLSGYMHRNLSYSLDEAKRKGLKMFLDFLA